MLETDEWWTMYQQATILLREVDASLEEGVTDEEDYYWLLEARIKLNSVISKARIRLGLESH